MRRSRQRKKIISIRQSGGWNNTGASSSVPSYESFTIPTPRGFPSKEVSTPGNNNAAAMDVSLTGRKRPASDAEHVQESTSLSEQTAPVDNNDGDFACQHSLDGGGGSTRPGVKQIVIRLSGLRQPAATSGEFISVNHGGEPVKDMGTGTKSLQETHRDVWSNATDCSENRQNNNTHSMNFIHPDFQSSQHDSVKPTVRILHQALQIAEEREPEEEPAETQKEDDRPGLPVNGENSGGSVGNLSPIDESLCVPESRDEQARSVHDLPARSCFPHPANPSWMPNANVSCRSCPGTTFSTNNSQAAASGCSACAGGTRFTTPGCSFQRGVPRGSATTCSMCMSPTTLRSGAHGAVKRVDFEGAQAPVMCAAQAMKQAGRNLVQPSQGHTCGSTAHYISSGDEHVLVCPAPWVHKGRLFPGVPAMCVDQQKYEVSWAPAAGSEGQGQPKPDKEREMPDPVFPPAHHTPSFSADLDMDTQRQLEEQIAHEILLLSQKLANLQARYGARRIATDTTKPAVLSCPQTPLLLDNRDVKCSNARVAPSQTMNDGTSQRPATSSSSRSSHRQPDSRCQLEERKVGGRYMGTSTKGAPSISSSRVSESGTVKNHPNSSRGSLVPGNSSVTTGSRAAEASLVQRWGKVLREAGKPSNKGTRTFSRKGRESRELVDECSYSDDMKEPLRSGGANVQGYPDGNKRFDWVKTLRFGGVSVRENQSCADFSSQMDSKPSSPVKEFTDVDAETWLRDCSENERFPTSMSKSVQAGGMNSPQGRVDKSPEDPPKRRPDSSIGKPVCKRAESPEEMGGLDSRLAHHLVKAGLRRAPSFWRVPGIRPVPNAMLKVKKKTIGSRSPRKDGGKRLRRRTLFEPPKSSNPSDIGEKNEDLELKVEPTRDSEDATDAQWQKEVGDYEAEYETFVENTSDVGLHHHHHHHHHHNNNTLDSEEYTSVVNREALISQEDGPQPRRRSPEKARLSTDVPVVSTLTKPTKKTFIRCIELVVATKKKNQVLSKLNGRKDSGIGYRRIVDCSERPSVYGMEKDRIHAIEGKSCQDDTQVAEEQTAKQSPKSKPSAMALMETQEIPKNVFEDSMAGDKDYSPKVLDNQLRPKTVSGHNNPLLQTKSGPSNLGDVRSDGGNDSGPSSSCPAAVHPVAMEAIIGEGSEEQSAAAAADCSPCVVDQVTSLACILSKQIEAEQLQEIFDALEKERLELPKIKTGCRRMGVTTRSNSPRDSGGVKRIAEQLKGSSTKQDKAKEMDAVEGVTLTKGRLHWSKIQQQKQAIVF